MVMPFMGVIAHLASPALSMKDAFFRFALHRASPTGTSYWLIGQPRKAENTERGGLTGWFRNQPITSWPYKPRSEGNIYLRTVRCTACTQAKSAEACFIRRALSADPWSADKVTRQDSVEPGFNRLTVSRYQTVAKTCRSGTAWAMCQRAARRRASSVNLVPGVLPFQVQPIVFNEIHLGKNSLK
jgi:hypothetical protein